MDEKSKGFFFLLSVFILVNIIIFKQGGYSYTQKESEPQIIEGKDNMALLVDVVEKYYSTHTYSEYDLFVCSDMSIDVWNIVKTNGINAEICAGNIKEDIFDEINWETILSSMDHAWVLAEVEPLTWIALETTGGNIVFEEENPLYYSSKICFENPKEFKDFLSLRDKYFEVCPKTDLLQEWWNEEVAGNSYSNMDEVYKEQGKIELLIEKCNEILTKLNNL